MVGPMPRGASPGRLRERRPGRDANPRGSLARRRCFAYACDPMGGEGARMREKPNTIVGAACAAGLAVAAACLPGSGPPLNPYQDDAAPASPINLSGEAGPSADVDLGQPFAITG